MTKTITIEITNDEAYDIEMLNERMRFASGDVAAGFARTALNQTTRGAKRQLAVVQKLLAACR